MSLSESLSNRVQSIAHAARAQLSQGDTGADDDHLTTAVDWLYRSQDVTGGGGSAATYNLVLGWEEQYPETTGYIVPTLYEYADGDRDSEAFERATAMTEWLVSVQRSDGAFPEGTGESGEPNVFNTGQAVFGLVEAARQTGDVRFVSAARAASDWLVEVQDESGAWTEFDYKDETHAYTTRVAWALLEAATVVDERRDAYRRAAAANLEWAVGKQRANGWFDDAAFTAGEDPYLHTIAYTIRGLLEGGRLLGDDGLTAAAKRSADALLEIQRRDGPLKGAYDEEWSPAWYHCLTGNAQMGIVWLRLYELTGDREYLLAARSTAEFLKRHQSRTGPSGVRGGVPGSYPHVGRYLFLRYPNWATKFFADLLIGLRTASDPDDGAGETGGGGDAETVGGGEAGDGGTETRDGDEADTEGAETTACRVCLLFDGDHCERWVAEAIERMLDETNAEISLVVVNEDAGLLGSGNVKRGAKYPAYAAFWIGARLRSKLSPGERYDDAVPVSAVAGVSESTQIRTYPANVSGLWNELPTEVVDEIRAEADVIVRRGFGLIRGPVLSATKYGVLSYHHGDPRAYRGGPAGFWEFMNDEEEAGMVVQTLTDELDPGVVQAYGAVDIRGCETVGAVRRRLYAESTGLLSEAIRAVQDDDDPMEVEELGPVYHPPSAGELFEYARKRGLGR